MFISYRRQDAAVVDELQARLSPTHPTWRDTERIRGGQVWREAIVRAIDRSYALVLIVSATTEHSKEVYAEYFCALGRDVPVIPLLIEACVPPFGLATVNARAWHQDPDQSTRDLIKDLDAYRDASPVAAVADELQTYLNSLRLAYLLNVGNYTPMLGEVRQQVRPKERVLRPVEMESRFSLRRHSVLRAEPSAVQVEEVRDHAELLPALHELRQVVLLGEPGIGKTTTLFKYADELCSRCASDPAAPIPVILPLREWKGNSPVDAFIRSHLGGLTHRYPSLIDEGRFYLLCDGLNEIARDSQRQEKVAALRQLCGDGVSMVVTCRELDYRDEVLRLDLDTIEIHPLESSRILDFLQRYLVDARGEEEGRQEAQSLFWQIAGGDAVQALWVKWLKAGASLNQFFQANEIPKEAPNVYAVTTGADDDLWLGKVKDASNLVHLVANPYLLWMCLNVHLDLGRLPNNRGGLFDEFVFQLLKREGLAVGDQANAAGQQLLGRLEALAWGLQQEAVAAGESGSGVELTLTRMEAVSRLGGEEVLHQAASANLLEDAEPVRFTHQLLQEYFSARRLLAELDRGLEPTTFWPRAHWWQVSGWEEASVLAAGLSAEAAHRVFRWVLPANPEVAAACIQRSGIAFDDESRLALREDWLADLTDVEHQTEPARAAIGRALGGVKLTSGAWLDNRPGVGLREDGVPDIAWVAIPDGRVVLEGGAGKKTLKPFEIARYPVTHIQFQAFVEAADGYPNPDWWQNLEPQEPERARWSECNAPRETVSWYEAVAFCRWLSHRLGQEARLPNEFEWQQAATGGRPKREYPWGDWAEGHCNSYESGLNRTTAVGLYPHGTWPDGPLDMAGNVWEWCLNKRDDPADERIDRSGDWRVLRGGSWGSGSDYCRAAGRDYSPPGNRDDYFGFRVVRPPSNDH